MTRDEGDSRGFAEVAQGVDERATGAVSGLAGLDASKAYPGVRTADGLEQGDSGVPGKRTTAASSLTR